MKRFRNYLFLKLVLVLTILFAATSFAQSNNSLKLLTLNFNAETANKILRTKRLAILENYAKTQNLDAIFIQECWDYENFKTIGTKLAQDLDMDLAYHLEDGVSAIRVTSLVVLTKKSLRLRNIKRFKLPRSAITFGNGQTTWFGLGEVDMLVGATITLENGQTAFLWTSHMNDASSVNRQAQAKFALTQMQSAAKEEGISWENAWVIFGGDFNSTAESPEQTFFREEGQFQDTWLLAHPNDPGHTLAGDVTDPEYNPMIHGAGLFPSQYAYQASQRIDYIYTHVPKKFGAQITRAFTAPVNNVWMSDHFGLLGTLDFTGPNFMESPTADSDFSYKTNVFEINKGNITNLPTQMDFTTNAEGGFTVVNNLQADTQITFLSSKKSIYTSSHAAIMENETVSFSFFEDGDYKYEVVVNTLKKIKIHGTIHVAN
jgi:endonuclease/exonuclease/phosphatase family metal-dependent hydrolase